MSLYKKVKEIKGIYKIKLEGFFIERFINLCSQRKIEIWNIKNIYEGLIEVEINRKDLEEIKEIANISRCKLEIIRKSGLPFLINKYKKRKIFLVSLITLFLIIKTLNLFIWKIEVLGDFSIPINEIKSVLSEENIKVGILKKNINLKNTKINIMLKRKDIAWMGMNIIGNKLVIEIVEKEIFNQDEDKDIVANLISDKEGIVEKIYVEKGEAKVKKGDFIEKGNILINGFNNNTNEEVRAIGEIILKTTYIEKSKIPFEKDIVKKTGNKQRNYKIQINNYNINLINKITNFEKYDTITKEKVFSLFGKIKFPIKMIENCYEELNIERIKYTEEQAKSIGIICNNEKINKKLGEKSEIIKHENKINVSENYLEVETIVQCLEQCGIYDKKTN